MESVELEQRRGTEGQEVESRPEGQDGSPGEFLGWHESVGAVALGFGRDAEPTVLDWAGRGRPDLLVTAGAGPVGRKARIYRAEESAEDRRLRYDHGADVPGLEGLAHLCPIANGGHSRFDLIALAESGLVWLPNEGGADEPRFGARRELGVGADLGLGPGRISQMIAVDWDGDGLTDLLVGFDALDGYWPDGEGTPLPQLVGFNQRAGHPGYDRAGQWRGKLPTPRAVWLRNVGSAGEPRFGPAEDLDIAHRLAPASRPAPMLAAWSGRGSWEFLISDAQGEVHRHRNFGGQRPPVLMEYHTFHLKGQPLVVPEDRTAIFPADLDGDGRDELVFGRSDGRVFAIHAGPHRDEVREPEPFLSRPGAIWLGGGAVVAAADLDGDGDLDLVVGDVSGRLSLVEDLGGPNAHRYATPVELEAGGEPFRLDPGPDGLLEGPVARRLGFACPALVDWNSNGRTDLLAGGAGGEVLYFRNNGGPTDPRFDLPRGLRQKGAALYTPPRVRPAAADWLGTGQVDLITLDLQGFLCVYPRVEKFEMGEPIPLVDRLGRLIRLDGGFGLGGRCALWAGEFAEPGRVDLLVGLPRDAHFVIPAITGESAESLDDLPTVLLLENAGRNVLIPRPVRLADGRPLAIGGGGCSPCGVPGPDGRVGLLIGTDEGGLSFLRRDELSW